MGKQSSRMVYKGKDHKDIYYQGHYHDAMYKGRQLVWEKIKEDAFYFYVYPMPPTYSTWIRLFFDGELFVDWGDGTSTNGQGNDIKRTNVTHEYNEELHHKWFRVKVEGNATFSFYSYYMLSGGIEIIISSQFPKNIKPNQQCFEGSNIIVIPNDLFYNHKNTSFYRMFSFCENLEYIPDGLLDGNLSYDFDAAFFGCKKISYVPYNLFDNCINAESFSLCFSGCENIMSELPALWEKEGVRAHTQCYSGCINASNYDEVPEDWR